MRPAPSFLRSMLCSRLTIVVLNAAACLALAIYLAGLSHWFSAAVLVWNSLAWFCLFVGCHQLEHGKQSD